MCEIKLFDDRKCGNSDWMSLIGGGWLPCIVFFSEMQSSFLPCVFICKKKNEIFFSKHGTSIAKSTINRSTMRIRN